MSRRAPARWAPAIAAAAAFVLAFAQPASAAVQADASFASPGQAQGRLTVRGAQWALLVFHAPAPAGFRMDLDGPVLVRNDTVHEYGLPTGVVQVEERDGPLRQPSSLAGPVTSGLGFGRHPWSSLYVEADAIEAGADGAQAAMQRADGDRDAAAMLPDAGQPWLATSPWGQASDPRGAALAVRSLAGDGVSVSIVARGVRHVAWHNATLDCRSAACPDAGEPWASAPSPAGVPMRRLSYIGLDAPGGALDGGGPVFAFAVGGDAVDVVVDGWLRLPNAEVAGRCGDAPCGDPAGRTLRGDGELAIAGLAADPRQPGFLAGRLSGAFEHAAFDEQPAPPGYATQAAVVAASVVGLVALAKALFALFARSSRPPALEQPRRRQVFETIRANPGLSYRDLQRRMGWPNGPLQKHLRRLADEGLVVGQRLRNTVRWFENHGRYDGTWAGVAQLNEPRAGRLHAWLRANPGVAQGRVVAEAAQWGWSRSATQRLLRNLGQARLVDVDRRGRVVSYTAVPAPAGAPA